MLPSSQHPSDRPAPKSDPRVGTTIGKYEIVQVIGRGGMGTVYEALNTTIGKRVAMKFVDEETARNKDAVARFQREAQAASAVESAHIVQIFDSGETETGSPFIVMELLRGEDLGHRIKRLGRLELTEALHIIAHLCRGLARAHQAGIIHRDLKPDNVFLVDRDDDMSFAKILDFGISKIERRGGKVSSTLTREGTVLGTPFYMSPEQAQALGDIDGRTDLWSVGAILFECLTGRPPHAGSTYEQVIVNICTKDADDVRVHNPGVPEAIAKVISKALSREREARYASARDLLTDLAAASGGLLMLRTGPTSGDDLPSGPRPAVSVTPDPINTPLPSPHRSGADDPMGLAPTLDARAEMGSKVGWSTSRKATTARDRKFYVGVGAVAALALGAIAFVALSGPEGATQHPETAPRASVRLVSNVPNARFSSDGRPLEGGMIEGHVGETKKVRVEADGYEAVEQVVPIDPSGLPRMIALANKVPEVSPAASPTPPPEPPPEPTGLKNTGKKPTSPTTTAAATTAKPALTAAPAKTSKGIAGDLQLKEN